VEVITNGILKQETLDAASEVAIAGSSEIEERVRN
jgi:hypothetical protein